jgi:hypothetical protein
MGDELPGAAIRIAVRELNRETHQYLSKPLRSKRR